jgi:hypothetical protein
MKNKKFKKKLQLNKCTVTDLGKNVQECVKGGVDPTGDYTICIKQTCPNTCPNTCGCTDPTCHCVY